ncbi:MAG: hypothetical protein J6A01_07255 [Proteobacteria bacterium]|nr:hypothetical protein [Pseudomonadota bacterium]
MQKYILSFVLLGLFFTSCQKADNAPAPEPAAPEVVWKEIPEDAIAFVRMHPGAAQKNTYANWKHYQSDDGKSTWRLQNRDISDEAVQSLEALITSADNNLIPADGYYTCRHQANMPEYRIEFTKNQKKYQIISISNCLNAAPFNIIVDGKSFIQSTGELGQALQKALNDSGIALKVGETAGMIMFDKPLETPPEGFSAATGESPSLWFDAKFRTDEAFAQAIAPIESAIAKLSPPEIACNQAKSPDCSTLMARYTLKIADAMEFQFSATSSADKVTAPLPPANAFESLAKAIQSPIVTAWQDAAERTEPIHLKWADAAECNMLKGIAKYLEAPENPSCASWTLTSKDFPTAIYYPGIDALWVEPGKDLKTYFDSVNSKRKELKQSKISFSKFSKPSEKRNLFIRLDGKTVSFLTGKDGKTSIE